MYGVVQNYDLRSKYITGAPVRFAVPQPDGQIAYLWRIVWRSEVKVIAYRVIKLGARQAKTA